MAYRRIGLVAGLSSRTAAFANDKVDNFQPFDDS